MGRRKKIPGKKHHGVKDPEVQRQKREALVKKKVNSCPKDLNSQEVPKKLQNLMKAKEELIQGNTRKKVKNSKEELLDSSKHMGHEMKLPGMKKPLKPIPVFKQQPGESQKKFFNRMERTVQSVLKRKEYEDKFDVEFVHNPDTGESKMQRREKDELETEMEEKMKKKLAKKGIVLKSKEEKRAMKRLKEKEKKMKKKRRLKKLLEQNEDPENVKETVEFNEVVHAPPSFDKKVFNKKKKGYEGLLLHQKLNQQSSVAKQQMLSEERLRVIDAYRKLKGTKMSRVKL